MVANNNKHITSDVDSDGAPYSRVAHTPENHRTAYATTLNDQSSAFMYRQHIIYC